MHDKFFLQKFFFIFLLKQDALWIILNHAGEHSRQVLPMSVIIL